MATRVISTKLAIEGESEYRSSLARINSEIKTLQSSLKLTESQYQTNANSMAALTAKGAALNNLYEAQKSKVKELSAALENAKKAETTYTAQKQQLKEKIDANNKALEALKNTTGDTTEEQEKLTAENKTLSAELTKCEANLNAATKGVNNWQVDLNNAEIKLNDLDAELSQNNKYLREAQKSTDGCATSIDEFGKKVENSATAADQLTSALMAAGVIAALKATANALEDCVNASIEFESAMAGVAKTTDLTEIELAQMGNSIKDLSTKIPATATEIANVTEAAGQLGIAKNDLLAFSEVMINLGVATNLSSTEAASSLAKFANVVGMSADNYERLGSTIVDLGNNFATTEADIVSMATRLASSGSIIGLTESEIMAVATALSSVGIEAEAGGSAISKLLKQFETMVQTGSPKLADFAAVAGMSADEFAKAWGNNAVQALSAFIDGLGAVDAAGGSSVAVLDELGITEVRMSNAVLALASSNGILNEALQTANKAWDENSALAKEAETRYETTESKLQLLSNSFENVKIAIGDKLTPAIRGLADTGTNLFNWLADVIEESDVLVPIIVAVATGMGTLVATATTLGVVITKVIPVIQALQATLAANPWAIVAASVAAVIAGLTVLFTSIKGEGIPSVKELTTAATDAKDAFIKSNEAYEESANSINATALMAAEYVDKLAALEKQGLNTAEAQTKYRTTVDTLNTIMPELNLTIDEQTGLVEGGTAAIRDQIDAWKELALQEALSTKYQEQIKAWADAELEVRENRVKLNEATTEGQKLQAEYNSCVERQQEIAKEMSAIYADNTMSVDEQTQAIWELEQQQSALDDRMKLLSVDIGENQTYQERLNKAISEGTDTVAENEQAVTDAQAALNSYSDATGSVTEGIQSNSEAVAGITERLTSLAEAYAAAYDSAYESISGQIGIFDTFAATVSADTDTVEKMMSIWGEQTNNLASYTENLQKAAQYGIDDGLIKSLSDGSTESAGYLATIISEIENLGGTTESMSEDAQNFVDEFNAAFASTEKAKEDFANTVASIQTDFDNAMEELRQAAAAVDFSGFNDAVKKAFANVSVDFNAIGQDMGSGLATGIESETGRVNNAAKTVAQGSVDTTRNTLDSHSDSRVMIKVGKDFVGGYITGIKSRESELKNVVQNLSKDISNIMSQSSTEIVKKYVDEMSKLPKETQSKLSTLKSTIKNEMSSLPGEMNSVGQQMVNGMINGLNNRSSALYSTIRRIVNNAIAAAKRAAATASPSKKTTAIFEDVGEGMVVGLEHKRKRIADTAQNVVDEALKLDVKGKVEAAITNIDDSLPEVNPVGQSGGDNRTYKIDININAGDMVIREEADVEKVANKIHQLTSRELRKRGLAAV